MLLPQEIIRKKRDGGTLSDAEIETFVEGLTAERIIEGQVAAFAMAVFFRGMNRAETVALTRAMAASGTRLSWQLPGPVVDKHSTGGIGDKVSLVVAPIMAACGAFMPKVSGRGLGHTGGTLDKLDSIPGYDTAPGPERFRAAVEEAGCAIIGQTADLAPADRRLYAIRDVTATLESIPLLTSSILSKKLAAGPDALVMDVKVGSGAFLPPLDAARDLARSLVEVANGAGLRCSALLTDMSRCLGRNAGNALEVKEAIDLLAGRAGDPRLHEVALALCAELLVLCGLEEDRTAARARAEQALSSGEAAERFSRMVSALGGPSDLIDRPDAHLPAAPVRVPVDLGRAGIVRAMDARALGVAVVMLGGGRRAPNERIDHAVGLAQVRGIGEPVDPDQPFAIVHARTKDAAEAAARIVSAAVELGEAADPPPLVIESCRSSEGIP